VMFAGNFGIFPSCSMPIRTHTTVIINNQFHYIHLLLIFRKVRAKNQLFCVPDSSQWSQQSHTLEACRSTHKPFLSQWPLTS
jgi:hypothetical protein